MWAVPRDSPLPHGNLEKVRLLFYEYISMHYCINTCSKL